MISSLLAVVSGTATVSSSTMAASLEELVGVGLVVEPSLQSPSVFLHLPPTPHHDNGVPSSEQQQQEDVVGLEHISRLLMEEEEDMHGMFLRNDDPALLHAQQSLAQIIASSSSSTSSGASDLHKDGNNAAVSVMRATATGAEPCSVMDLLNMAFVKGREEGCKFLPKDNNRLAMKDTSRNGHLETTGRACKLMATMARPEEEAQVQELMGRMMLDDCEVPPEEMERLRVAMADEAAMSNSRETRRRRQQEVDMRTLLLSCAQAVDERHGARELLEQAKQHASPTGDATQRLAHCFVEALEARLAGTGSVLHRSLAALDTTTLLQGPEFLRAYRLFHATCCFQRVGFAFANMAICRAAAGSSRLHVVDYGLHLGLQWPGLLRRLAARDGGPPEVTITCIDHPLPGFRPARHIEEMGHMLSDCARELGVPLKFHAVAAARWDNVPAGVRVEVDPDPGAVVVVNSLFKLETLADDSLVVDRASPRDSVLAGIRRMRPAVFTHGVVNGLCGNSFMTRFREALFYFSAAFDMLDATLPRNSEQRMVLERDFLRACVVNVVACEGRDRTDRFDTYKQWQQRSRRAGLRQLPLDPAVVGEVREMVKQQCYHRDFVIDENDGWLLQGWKGRILYAHSAWVADQLPTRGAC